MERNVTVIFLCRERSATGLVNITSRGTKRMRPAGRYVQNVKGEGARPMSELGSFHIAGDHRRNLSRDKRQISKIN